MVTKEKEKRLFETSLLPSGVRKYIRYLKQIRKEEEAKEVWKNAENKSNKIRKRKEKFIDSLEELLSGGNLRTWNELRGITSEEAKKIIEKIEGVPSSQRDEKFSLKDQIIGLWKSSNSETLHGYLYLLTKVYPKDIEFLISVDGAGKTAFLKWRNEVFSSKPSKKGRRF